MPVKVGSFLCGMLLTCTGSSPKADGLFSNMRTLSATDPPGSILRKGAPGCILEDLSDICCFCSGVSSGWGAEGISFLRLFLLLNCSNKNAEGSSPHGLDDILSESLSNKLLPMEVKLLGLTPPNAILCFASSNLFLIERMLVSGSLTAPKSSNKLGICICSLFGLDTAN